MALLDIIIGGILQGLTEFLPISSSAHLILYGEFIQREELPLVLNLAFHSGTALSLLIYFRRDWYDLVRREIWARSESPRLFVHIVVASIPICGVGLLAQDLIATYLHRPAVVVLPLMVVGILLWLIDRRRPQQLGIKDLNYRQSFVIGLWQTLALIPGVSRSGVTMLATRLYGLSRPESVRTSFLLGTPIMVGALLLNLRALISYLHEPKFLLGVFVSAGVGFLVIKFLLRWIAGMGFGVFAIYRLILAFIVVCLLV